VSLYLEHFGLTEAPFRITPHTDFFFDGADRGATLDALMYAIVHDEGIVKVSGEVGSGKTMLCRVLMERLPAQVETIYLATPSLARDEILHAIADELDLRLSQERTTVALRELQEQLIRLYAAGRRVVILIDEAHVMPDETLEQVRLLSNLESNRHKLLQIVLFGQPELDVMLAKPTLRQLRDRITHAFRMRPLSSPEVTNYIAFRMRAAGYRGPDVFSPRASLLMARASGGLTRRINILADKSLLSAFTENTHGVTDRHVKAAIADSEFSVVAKARHPGVYVGAALAAGVLLGIAIHWAVSSSPQATSARANEPVAQAPKAAPIQPESIAPQAPVLPVVPATTEPQKNPEGDSGTNLSPAQAKRLRAYSTVGQKLLTSRVSATRQLLERAPDERYAIELFMTENTDPARMERFLQRARELVPLAELFVIPMTSGGQYRLRVVLGEFESREAAIEAGRRLPPKYQQAFRTSPKSFGELRSQI
jgi:type II secretory pathway predicted ATPase ExeA